MMGRQYEQPFRQLVDDLDPTTLLAYVDPDQIHPHYRVHIVGTLEDLGATMAPSVDAANFVVNGYVARDSDAVIGLAIYSDIFGAVALFPEGHSAPVEVTA
jgi:hypothetical protein